MLTQWIQNNIKNSLLKQGIGLALALPCLYFASRFLLMASGYFPQPSLFDCLLMALLLLFFNASKKLFYFVLLPFVLIQALYAPVGLMFGPPSYQYVASVFATDLLESQEFLRQLPAKYIAVSAVIIGLVLLFRQLCLAFGLQLHKNKVLIAVAAALMLFNSAPLKFMQEGVDSLLKVKQELARLNNLSIESQWGTSQLVNSQYDDYVLIIGESARKDYHHAYGYGIENTPFMSSTNGTLIDGLTSGGTNTIASLKLMLTLPDKQNWEGNYALNLVDLVKSAGIKTYWLSNQGYLGTFDTPISAIANKSDEKIFLKYGDSLNSNVSDFKLLPKFTALLAQPSQQKRFIVLHLYGSHPLSCDRVQDYNKIFAEQNIEKKYININCYISSIKKTDELLQQVYQSLQQNWQKNHRSFSMIYFSDHGLPQHEENGALHILNTKQTRAHFQVPLFKISSDDQQRRQYQAFKSALNFTEGVAHWIGIQNPLLQAEDLFSPQADPQDYGLQQKLDKLDQGGEAVLIPSAN